jgi:catechol 2,3-dioxygenase-like lactoylglutathione lyase family enzyme
MILSVGHTGFVVRDIERSIAFYEGLGLVVWKRRMRTGADIDVLVGIPEVKLEWAKLRAPDESTLELIQYHSHPDYSSLCDAPSNRHGCSHIAFVVEDLPAACKQFIRMGGSIVNCPTAESFKDVWAVYGHDLDGIIVELVRHV